MSENLFEVYMRIGDCARRLASNMDIYDALLFIQAWMPLPEPYRAERRTDE